MNSVIKILTGIKGKVLDATHYELLANAYDLQQQNINQLKENNSSLKESNQILKEKLETHKKELFKLKQSMAWESNTKKEQKENPLDGLTKPHFDILTFLSENESLELEQITQHLNIKQAKTEYYLDLLIGTDLIEHITLVLPSKYLLNKKGRKLLVEKELL